MAAVVALLAALVAGAILLRRLRFDGATVALVLAGIVLDVVYLRYTSIDERNYDAASHVQYVQAIAQGGSLPRPDACGACGHPPLYYALAAGWSKVGGDWAPLESRLQYLSLLLFFGFVVVALLIFRSCGAPPWTLRVATALVVFWPSSVINSVRVHNDALASLLMLTALYFIACWDSRGRAAHFYAALAACVLALLTKATGYTVAATLLLVALLRLRSTGLRPRSLLPSVVAAVALTLAAALPALLRESERPRNVCQHILGTACDGRYVPLAIDRPSRFVYFDVVDFVRRTDALPKDPEHDYFLNRFAKSSLFGVMPLGEDFADERRNALPAFMSAALLGMILFCVISLPSLRARQLQPVRVYVLASAIMFAFLVAFRVRAPNEFHEDFRHVFPTLVPFCLGYAALARRAATRSKVMHVVGAGLASAMVVSSIAFFFQLR